MTALADCKAHLNLDTAFDDDLLTIKIAAAEDFVSRFIAAEEPIAYDDAPPSLQEAIRQLVAHWYENREATLVGSSVGELPIGFHDLLAAHRTWAF